MSINNDGNVVALQKLASKKKLDPAQKYIKNLLCKK